jgi:23S rRNA (cytosine1962-C5)-methyltransferase
LITVRVNRKAAGRVASGHPWIFSSDVTDRAMLSRGTQSEVVDPRGKFLGRSALQLDVEITLRMLADRDEPIEREFFQRRITAAIQHRKRVVRDSTAYRLIFL